MTALTPSSTAGCPRPALVFQLTLKGDRFQLTTPRGKQFESIVQADGSVFLAYQSDPQVGRVTVTGNAKSRQLQLTASAASSCHYALAPSGSISPPLAEAGERKTASVCDQRVEYSILPPDPDIASARRAFSGFWVGEFLETRLCIALAVESMTKEGIVQAKYAYGQKVQGFAIALAIPPRTVTWLGAFEGNMLRLQSPDVSHDLRLADADRIDGVYVNTRGRWTTMFRRQ
jgi:hypothetical protein